ncbi:MAG: amidohydrolase family protein [Wenzhouxiangellaceae bacterium]|nr:amidohydrolase family protein [Wenzhouxiangellaceae bacterium]MBS3824895.1 amidohydrolase family protein [Wenzhouxiangellaceae bacterium]
MTKSYQILFNLMTATLIGLISPALLADEGGVQEILFDQVRVFDGTSDVVTGPTRVLVRGNTIAAIGNTVEAGSEAQIIDGQGNTLMPGLIDAHYHLTFSALSMQQMLAPDITPEKLEEAAAREAENVLMRGFTTVRDMGGPVWGVAAGIRAGRYPGPRVWPSGALVSQTSGHGDMRLPNERSRRFFGEPSRAELMGATFIADGRGEVLTAVRENLRFGASQIKLTAGGGTSSAYDPIDVTQYTFEELKAAVQAAEDWGTYISVHAYTPRAIRRSLNAGVKVIEHGQLADEASINLIKENDAWLSLQVLRADTPDMDPLRRAKRKALIDNQPHVWAMARDLGINLAWGTDFLFEPDLNHEQNSYIVLLREWFTPAGALKIVTHDNARLLALSGLRSPYQGTLGVIEEDALADLILVDGNPLVDLELIGDPASKFLVIMKDGVIYKNMIE